MKKVSCFAVCVFLSFLWIPLVSAAPDNGAAAQKQAGQVQDSPQSGQVIRPKAGISWKEKVLKQREIQKKAAARRNILMQQAEKERQKNAPPPAMNP
jgi:hypothetical protein